MSQKSFLNTYYGEFKPNIILWQTIWSDLTKGNESLLTENPMNPHLLLLDIKDEIQFNRLKNKNVLRFFKEQIGYYLEKDPVIKTIKSDFILISKELDFKRLEYFLQLCDSVLKMFKNGEYFEASVDLLAEKILSSSWTDADTDVIELLSRNIIIEFILRDFSQKSINQFAIDIFDTYEEESGHYLTSFPCITETTTFSKEGILDRAGYNSAIRTEIENLTVEDRLKALKRYYFRLPQKGFGILPIKGLKGDVQCQIGDVIFYSPKVKRYLSFKFGPKDIENPESDEINAAVEIEFRDIDIARMIAVEKTNTALDILHLFEASDAPLSVNPHSFVISDGGNPIGASWELSIYDPFFYKFHSLNLKAISQRFEEEEYFEVVKEFTKSSIHKNIVTEKLIQSLHWYRKANDSINFEDKLLFLWIVIENLATIESKLEEFLITKEENPKKILLINDVISAMEIKILIIKKIIDLYNELLVFFSSNSHLLDQSIKDSLKMEDDSGELALKDFVGSLPVIKPKINDEKILHRIGYIENLSGDNSFAIKELEHEIKRICQDIMLIYRYRNLIVHNAKFNSRIIPYYIQKAKNYALHFLSNILYGYIEDKNSNYNDILFKDKIQLDRLLGQLTEGQVTNILEYFD